MKRECRYCKTKEDITWNANDEIWLCPDCKKIYEIEYMVFRCGITNNYSTDVCDLFVLLKSGILPSYEFIRLRDSIIKRIKLDIDKEKMKELKKLKDRRLELIKKYDKD